MCGKTFTNEILTIYLGHAATRLKHELQTIARTSQKTTCRLSRTYNLVSLSEVKRLNELETKFWGSLRYYPVRSVPWHLLISLRFWLIFSLKTWSNFKSTYNRGDTRFMTSQFLNLSEWFWQFPYPDRWLNTRLKEKLLY